MSDYEYHGCVMGFSESDQVTVWQPTQSPMPVQYTENAYAGRLAAMAILAPLPIVIEPPIDAMSWQVLSFAYNNADMQNNNIYNPDGVIASKRMTGNPVLLTGDFAAIGVADDRHERYFRAFTALENNHIYRIGFDKNKPLKIGLYVGATNGFKDDLTLPLDESGMGTMNKLLIGMNYAPKNGNLITSYTDLTGAIWNSYEPLEIYRDYFEVEVKDGVVWVLHPFNPETAKIKVAEYDRQTGQITSELYFTPLSLIIENRDVLSNDGSSTKLAMQEPITATKLQSNVIV